MGNISSKYSRNAISNVHSVYTAIVGLYSSRCSDLFLLSVSPPLKATLYKALRWRGKPVCNSEYGTSRERWDINSQMRKSAEKQTVSSYPQVK